MENLMSNPELIKNARFEISGNDLVTLAKTLATELIPKKQESKGDENQILSTEEVCKVLGVSRVTLHDWHKKGILQHRKIGRRAYYYRSDIDTILKNK